MLISAILLVVVSCKKKNDTETTAQKIQAKWQIINIKETGVGIPGLIVHAFYLDTPIPQSTKQKIGAELLFERKGGAVFIHPLISKQL